MLALAYILCERRPRSGSDWETEARFLMPTPSAFLEALGAAGLGERQHPGDLSLQVSTDLLFEDGDIVGQTFLRPDELPALLPHADPDMALRLRAWAVFAQALEQEGQEARLIIWFIR